MPGHSRLQRLGIVDVDVLGYNAIALPIAGFVCLGLATSPDDLRNLREEWQIVMGGLAPIAAVALGMKPVSLERVRYEIQR